MKKRLLALLLSAALILSLTTPAAFAGTDSQPETEPQQTETVEKCECGLDKGHEGECPPAKPDGENGGEGDDNNTDGEGVNTPTGDSEDNTNSTDNENVSGENGEPADGEDEPANGEDAGDKSEDPAGDDTQDPTGDNAGDPIVTTPVTTPENQTSPANNAIETVDTTCVTCGKEECTCVKVGSTIWIKSGSKVYVDYKKGDSFWNAHTVWGNYEVTVTEIFADESGTEWYKFDATGTLLESWKYVKVENTSVTEPEEEVDDPLQEELEDGTVINITGNLPEDVQLEVNVVTDSAKETALDEINVANWFSDADILFCKTFDINLYSGGVQWQPANGETVTVTLSGEDFEDLLGMQMIITHILDTETAVARAVANNEAIAYTAEGLSEIYPVETAAVKAVTGEEDTFYYVQFYNEGGRIEVDEESISFGLDSFSEVQVVGYNLNTTASMPDIPTEGSLVVDKNVTWTGGDNYKLTLEAYSTGMKFNKATDVVFIIDQSCSMYSPVEPDAAIHSGNGSVEYSKMTYEQLQSLDMTVPENQKGGMEGYYVAVFEKEDETVANRYFAIPLRYHNGKWQRTEGDGSTADNKWVSETITEIWNYGSYTSRWMDLTPTWTDGATFTIYKSVYGAAYDAMEAFADEMEREKVQNCRAGIVAFSCPYKSYSSGPMQTGIFIDGTLKLGIDQDDFSKEDYIAAFNDMATAAGIESFRNSVDAIRTSGQSTTTDAGFYLAKQMISEACAEGTDRVVILFTDGKPERKISTETDDNFTAAIKTAKALTDGEISNTKVYTFGPSAGYAPIDFLQALSSTYPNATSRSDLGELNPEIKDTNKDGEIDVNDSPYWGIASNSDDLQKAFAAIAQQIILSGVSVDDTAVLKDIIADEFKLPDLVEGQVRNDQIGVYTAPWDGSDFGEKVTKPGLTVNVTDDNTIEVSGFHYEAEENWVIQGYTGGNKLIVEIPIVVDRNVCKGGNDLETNKADSAIWSAGTKVMPFPIPEVDVMTTVTVTKKVVDDKYAGKFAFNGTYGKFTSYSPDAAEEKDLTANAPVTSDTLLSSIGNGESFTLSGVKVGTALVVYEPSFADYNVDIVVKDASGNVMVDGVTIDKATGKVTIASVKAGMTIEFTNTLKRADLTLVKTGSREDIDPYQTFIFHVVGKENTRTEDIDMKVVVKGDTVNDKNKVTIKNLPIGNYTVTEENGWSWRYTVDSVSGQVNGVITDGKFNLPAGEETVTFLNDRDEKLWIDGNNYCQNIFKDNGYYVGEAIFVGANIPTPWEKKTKDGNDE